MQNLQEKSIVYQVFIAQKSALVQKNGALKVRTPLYMGLNNVRTIIQPYRRYQER